MIVIKLYNASRYALSFVIVLASTDAVAEDETDRPPPPVEVIIASGETIDVDDDVWAEARQRDVVQRWLRAKMLVENVGDEDMVPHADAANTDLTQFSPAAVVGLIKDITDIEELNQIMQLDNRRQVVAAIEKRKRELDGSS